jgi:hypothetical protein
MPIPSPKLPLDHPDRVLSCEEAMEERFNELLDTKDVSVVFFEALAAGWNEDEVRLGLCCLRAAKAESALDLEP